MKRLGLLILILFTLSCSTDEVERKAYTVEIINSFIEAEILVGYGIYLLNVSNRLIIEITYKINEYDYSIIDDIVPKQQVVILDWIEENIVCEIIHIEYY